jgi:hypothetical protein
MEKGIEGGQGGWRRGIEIAMGEAMDGRMKRRQREGYREGGIVTGTAVYSSLGGGTEVDGALLIDGG